MDRAKIEEMRKIVSDECNRVARLLMGDTPPGGALMHKTLITLVCTLLLTSPASASFDAVRDFAVDVGRFTYGTTLKVTGAVLALALHESCHVGVTAAFGGYTRVRGVTFYSYDISDRGHRTSSVSGGVCTGVLSELIIAKGWHRKSHLAWGAVAFHSVTTIMYGAVRFGDAEHWTVTGGNKPMWKTGHYLHGGRTTYVLGRDFDLDFMLNRKWKKR
jgi:hypothetical protein